MGYKRYMKSPYNFILIKFRFSNKTFIFYPKKSVIFHRFHIFDLNEYSKIILSISNPITYFNNKIVPKIKLILQTLNKNLSKSFPAIHIE